MSSLKDVYEAAIPEPQPKCKVCDWLLQQSPEDREFFETNVRKNMAFMARVCADQLGLDAEETTVRKHVRSGHQLNVVNLKRRAS